ncbi:MAG: FHA domain-containing protein [Deltaproteobacteria bacterium]|nr:FHA domain-containing protein [Deltaproteobacteria bacterium]
MTDERDQSSEKQASRLKILPGKELTKELLAKGEAAFRHRYNHPFLAIMQEPPSDDEWVDPQTVETAITELVARAEQGPVLKVVRIVKSSRNVFGSKITVGRAKNNDIIIRASKISKLHAAFIPAGKNKYKLLDMGSSNGTFINGVQLKAKESKVLKSKDEIVLWRYVFEYIEIDDLLKRLRGSGKTPNKR